MINAVTDVQSDYVLGHTAQELERLNKQAALVEPFTRRFLEGAGISLGMRVLDVGCGGGDVSLLARELVGTDGEVVGVDRSEAAVAHANGRASANRFTNMSFLVGDPSEMAFERTFDAVIGRYVLVFQSNPAAMLGKLAQHLRSGGTIVFHEPDLHTVRSFPSCPGYDQCWQWINSTVKADVSFGVKFPSVFRSAGLPFPTMRLEALVGAGSNSEDLIELTVGLVGTLLREIERQGIATAAEVDIGSLKARLAAEAAGSRAFLLGRYEIGAWCQKV